MAACFFLHTTFHSCSAVVPAPPTPTAHMPSTFRPLSHPPPKLKMSTAPVLMACAILATMTAFIAVAFFRSRLMRLVGGNETKLLALLALDIAATTALLFGIAVLFAG